MQGDDVGYRRERWQKHLGRIAACSAARQSGRHEAGGGHSVEIELSFLFTTRLTHRIRGLGSAAIQA